MRKIIALLIYSAISTISIAQKTGKDIVYLKDGNIIRGIIIEQIPNKTVRIYTTKGDTLTFQVDRIEQLKRESFTDQEQSKNRNDFRSHVHLIMETGGVISLKNEYSTFLKLNLIGLYRIKPKTLIGIGTGLRYDLIDNRLSPIFNDFGIPLFAEFRTLFTDKKISGFVAIDLGYSFDLANNVYHGIIYEKPEKYSFSDIKGVGVLICPTLGLSFLNSDKSAINLGIGFETHFYENYWEYKTPKYIPSISVGINVGILF